MMLKKSVALLLLLPFTLCAQEWDDQVFNLENNPPPHYPFSVSGCYLSVAPASFRTPGLSGRDLTYKQGDIALAYTHPLSEYCGLIFGAGWINTEVDMQNNPEFNETWFNYINASIGAYTSAFPDWTWTLTFAPYMDLAHFSLIDYTLYDGVLWGKYDFSKWIELDFGVIVEVGLHKEKVWPIIGFVYLPCDNWRISAVYPIDISIEYDFWKYWTAGGSLRFLRNRHRVGSDEPNPQGIFEYRTTGAEFDLTCAPFDRFSVTGFAGSTFKGDFKVTNSHNENATHYKFNGSFYAGVSAVLSF